MLGVPAAANKKQAEVDTCGLRDPLGKQPFSGCFWPHLWQPLVLLNCSWNYEQPSTNFALWKLLKIGTFFCATATFPSNSALSWWTILRLVILVMSSSIQGIIYPCLVKFQKSHFTRLNCQFEFVSICVQYQPRLENKNQDHFLAYFDVPNLVVISIFPNKLLLKGTFFEVSPLTPFCMKFLFIYFKGSVLKTEHILELVLTNRV